MPNFFLELSMGFEGQSYAHFFLRALDVLCRAKLCPFFWELSMCSEGRNYGQFSLRALYVLWRAKLWPIFCESSLCALQGKIMPNLFWELSMGSEGQNNAHFFLKLFMGFEGQNYAHFFWELSMCSEGQYKARFSSRRVVPFKCYWFRTKSCPFFFESLLWPKLCLFFFRSSPMGHVQGQTMPDFPLDASDPSNTTDSGQNCAHFFCWEPLMAKTMPFSKMRPHGACSVLYYAWIFPRPSGPF